MTGTAQHRPAFRLTPRRRAVLDVVRAATDHPTAREILERVSAVQPGIGVATVYRTLALLVEHGEVLELQLGDEAARYDGNVGRHDHVVCTRCGAAADVAAVLQPETVRTAAEATGYVVEDYELALRGRCRACTADGTGRRGSAVA